MIINNKETIFNSYLAGLFEGDGHIWLPRENNKNKNNPIFCITFNIKDKELAIKLLDKIGFGHIKYKTKNNACVLIISPVKGLKRIISCINGKLRTPKIVQIYKLIDWLNKNHSSEIKKLGIQNDCIYNDAWLAGFIDAEGSFSIVNTKIENGAKKRKTTSRLRLEQIMFDPISNDSYFDILSKIAKFLNCNLRTREQKTTNNKYFTLEASNRKSLLIIISYFNNFPLYSSKYLDYKDWLIVSRLILEDKHYTTDGVETIDYIKNNMNLKRVHFNWDHLNNL